MKQLSARRFRLTFPDITEPVLVITRTSEGYRDLGTWTPATTVIGNNEHYTGLLDPFMGRVHTPSSFGHSVAAPKPSARKPR